MTVRLHRRPVFRLLVAGAALVALAESPALRAARSDAAPRTIVIDAARRDGARRAFVAASGRAPSAAEEELLVAAEVDDEILYREALARGLAHGDSVVQHRLAGNLAFVEDGPPPGLAGAAPGDAVARDMLQQDVVVRRRLVDRMRARLEEPALAAEPSDAELGAALAAQPERFALPARARIAVARAAAVPAMGTSGVRELPLQSERDLARSYGAALARAAFTAEPGRWTEPVPATSGPCRVLVHEREPARAPDLAAVRNQVRAVVRRERADRAVRHALDVLRGDYAVSLADAPADEG